MKRLGILIALCASAMTFGFMPSAQAAGSSCSGYTGGSKTVTFGAFVGHNVRATYKWCSPRPKGFIGPVQTQYLRGVSTPDISLPSRFPGSWGEDVDVTKNPSLYSWSKSVAKFRFTVKQTHIKIGPSSTYDFELRVYPGGKGKICFVDYGHGCSSLQ